MDKKKLAKTLAAVLLTAAAVNVQASDVPAAHEGMTLLAMAACGGGSQGGTPPGGDYYQDYSFTADDANNPYNRPGNPNQPRAMGGGYGSGYGAQPSGNYGGGASMQNSPYGTERRVGGGNMQNSPYGSDRSMGAGNYGGGTPVRSNDPNANPYNRTGGGTNPNAPVNPSNTWDANRR